MSIHMSMHMPVHMCMCMPAHMFYFRHGVKNIVFSSSATVYGAAIENGAPGKVNGHVYTLVS